MGIHNPPHPGAIIKEFCIKPLDLTVTKAAESLGVTRKTFSMLLNGKSGNPGWRRSKHGTERVNATL